LTATTSFNRDGSFTRVHTCISQRVYEQFPGDHGHTPNLAVDIDTSCDELESGSEDTDVEEILSDVINVSTLLVPAFKLIYAYT
jgi:hypothetical protein